MLIESKKELDWIAIDGSNYEIGYQLGCKGKWAVHHYLIKSALWLELTQDKYKEKVEILTNYTRQFFPEIWNEIEGLAAGLELPVSEVMAWNCRGELLASSPDGCTTVQLPGEEIIIAHNEDGLPFFRGYCFIANISPNDEAGFISFCYPGSIAGHTFAVNEHGLVNTVNNLRIQERDIAIPRMVLGRAILNTQSVDDALSLIKLHCYTGGFHFTLAQSGRADIISAEFGGGSASFKVVDCPSVHANHALHLKSVFKDQIITQSSKDRQNRGNILVQSGVNDPLIILRDKSVDSLPIWRDDPCDPDEENTLGTFLVTIGQNELSWSIYDRSSGTAIYKEQYIAEPK